MTKALSIILILLSPFMALAKGFTIKGYVEALPIGTVTLTYQTEGGDDTTISTSINDFKFTLRGHVPEPELAKLTITGGWSYNTSFFLEDGAINISLVRDAPEMTSITGSASNMVYQKLKPGLNEFFEEARQNTSAHVQAMMDYKPAALQRADSLWAAQQHRWMQTLRSTMTGGAEDYAALYFIQWMLFKPGDLDNMTEILGLFMHLSISAQRGQAGKKFDADFQHLFKIIVGNPAPEINGKDTTGQPVTLASHLGQVVLLDFWASYCGPCRQENQRMKPVYEKYHKEGLEVISFSLDNERSLWVQALRNDGLPWSQASDLRGGAGATAGVYDISDLPRNVLIDRTGHIYAKDIHGDELRMDIEMLLGEQK